MQDAGSLTGPDQKKTQQGADCPVSVEIVAWPEAAQARGFHEPAPFLFKKSDIPIHKQKEPCQLVWTTQCAQGRTHGRKG